jgi:NitT/TauT family transport system substrate-binding protein
MIKLIRAILAALSVMFLTSGFSVPALAQANTTPGLTELRIGGFPGLPAAQIYVGQDLGIFKKYGLEVTYTPLASGAVAATAVLAGSLDLGLIDAAALGAAHLHNLPLLYVAPGPMDTDRAPAITMMVKPDSPLRTGKDFNGKTVGCTAIKGMGTVAFAAWMDANGGDSKTLKLIEFPVQQTIAAIANGTLDAGLTVEPFVTNGITSGQVRAIVLLKGGLRDFMLTGWAGDSAWLNNNAQTIAKFRAAVKEAGAIANQRPMRADVAAVIAKYTKMPVSLVSSLQYFTDFGDKLEARQIQPVIDVSAKYGLIDKSFPATDVMFK